MTTDINRREFLVRTAIAGGALLAFADTRLGAGPEESPPPAAKPLRLLILGGTGFIGPHYVRAAVERGHNVSVFNRGKDHVTLPPNVERLIGDRNGDLEAIKNRDWDGVIDLPVYTPIWVRTLGEALRGRVKHYTFISTQATYDMSGAPPIDEKGKLVDYQGATDPYSNPDTEQYGPLKVISEREAERQFPGKTLILRPDYIVGPGDPQEMFTYWIARMELGGEVLAPGDPLEPVQFIDVRDLAEWSIRLVEKTETGIFNAVGPASTLSLCEMLGGIRGTFSVPVQLTWVPRPWLLKQKTQLNRHLMMWTSMTPISNDKARANGLSYRPLRVTVAETLAWHKTRPAERQAALISSNMTLEQSLLAAWHADRGKAV